MLLTFGFVGIAETLRPPDSRGKFVWWIALPVLFGIFGALVLAVIGLQDLARQRAPRRPTSSSAGTDIELAHRWGRTIFGGAYRLAGLCCAISIALGLVSGMPGLQGLALGMVLGGGLSFFVALVAFLVYLFVVGPRVAYFTIVRYFRRGGPSLPGPEVQAMVHTIREADAAHVPAPSGAPREDVTIRPDTIQPELPLSREDRSATSP
jgi:hypothetical protein